MSFFVFGVAGLIWAVVWYAWFRDSPEEKRGLASPPSTAGVATSAGHAFPWRLATRSTTVWSILGDPPMRPMDAEGKLAAIGGAF